MHRSNEMLNSRGIDMENRADEQHEKEWREVHKRIKRALEPFGDDDAGGDYWVVDLVPISKIHMVELHRLHMLRPAIIKALHGLLLDFPDWQIEICAICMEEEIMIDVETGLILSKDGIIDALEKKYLPEKYRFVYENSRRPPPGFNYRIRAQNGSAFVTRLTPLSLPLSTGVVRSCSIR